MLLILSADLQTPPVQCQGIGGPKSFPYLMRRHIDYRTLRAGEGFMPGGCVRARMHAFSHSPVEEEEEREDKKKKKNKKKKKKR